MTEKRSIADNLNNLNISGVKKPKKIFKQPYTIDHWCGKDTEENSKPIIGESAKDPYTCHILQYEQNIDDFSYEWNSFGLRGPEPDYNKSNRIIIAGGSLSLGTGVSVENSFPHILADMLDASYINLSDADSLTNLIDPLSKFKDYNPTHVIISDTRFINSFGWVMIDIFKSRRTESMPVYKNIFQQSDIDVLKLFDFYLKGLFPNAKLVLANTGRRAWKETIPEFQNIQHVPLPNNLVVDLARDNVHPGPKSHFNIANEIYTSIT